MTPTLEQLEIHHLPVFIRKIDNRNHWYPQGYDDDLEGRVQRVSEKIFKKEKCSIWKINKQEEFYGVIASLSANRDKREQDVDFIWITEEELNEVSIKLHAKPEGKCLDVKDLHFDIYFNRDQAKALCCKLIQNRREANRCQRADTKKILEHQERKKCRAVVENQSSICCCESQQVFNP